MILKKDPLIRDIVYSHDITSIIKEKIGSLHFDRTEIDPKDNTLTDKELGETMSLVKNELISGKDLTKK